MLKGPYLIQHIAEFGSAAVVNEFCSAQAVQFAVVPRFAAVVVGLGFVQVPVFFFALLYSSAIKARS